MGAKGLWRHVLGTTTAPVLYVVSKGTSMLANGTMPATEDQIEAKETKIVEFEKSHWSHTMTKPITQFVYACLCFVFLFIYYYIGIKYVYSIK